MDLALNNLKWLICHKTKGNQFYDSLKYFYSRCQPLLSRKKLLPIFLLCGEF